jgi:hypothetical protein
MHTFSRNHDLVSFLLYFDPDLVTFILFFNADLVAFPICFSPDLVVILGHAHLSKIPIPS